MTQLVRPRRRGPLVHASAIAMVAALLAGCSAASEERTPSAAAAQTGAADLNAWSGEYQYANTPGRTAGGTPAIVSYQLAITAAASAKGELRVQGFQTDESLVCDVTGTPDEIAISFRTYQNGRTQNEFGVAVYQPGQVLFTLRRAADGALVTTWGALRPDGTQEVSGRFFERRSAAGV
jgi:hypothetical protein